MSISRPSSGHHGLILLLVATLSAALSPLANAAPPQRILLFGATGEVGGHILEEALNRGHRVTAVSRKPEQITQTHDNLKAVRGDLLDKQNVSDLVKNQDVIVTSVRGVIGDKRLPQNSLQFIAVTAISNALRAGDDNSTRLIHVGGAGTLEVKPGVSYAQRLPLGALPQGLRTEIRGQVQALLFLRQMSDVRWTYITPPKNFTNGPRTGKYQTGGDQSYGSSRLSRADFAVALLDEIEQAKFVQERFSVAY